MPLLKPIDHSEHGHRRFVTVYDVWERLPLRELRFAATAAVVGATVYGAIARRGAIERTAHELVHAHPGWVALAAVAEVGSLLAYAVIVRRLLLLGEVDVPLLPILGATVTGIAMLNSLPGGGALSSVYWYQQLRRNGAGRGLAAIVLATAAVIGIVTIVYLTVTGVALEGSRGLLGGARTPIIVGAALFLAVWAYCHRQIAAGFRRLAHRVAGPAEPLANARIAPREVATLMSLGYLNWLLDGAALVVSLTAVGATVPWKGVLLAYALGQLVASIPLLPGGGGTVEASIVLGLVAYGGTSGALVAGVVLFRVVSAWGIVPIGWAAWALTSRRAAQVAAI